jgi:anti-sigma factor RsiW
MTDHWTHALSDHLDGDLPPSEARALERHLETCAECRETLAALRAVKDRAAALVDPPAPDDLWAGIASRIGTAGSTSASEARILELPRRQALAPWLLPAAAAALLAVVLALPWLMGHWGRSHRGAGVAAVATPEPAQLASFDATEVEGEIAQLQAALDRGRGKLDPKTIAVLEKNLKVIRAATEDARRALAADPANRELQDYFAATVQSKLRLMRQATAMAGV